LVETLVEVGEEQGVFLGANAVIRSADIRRPPYGDVMRGFRPKTEDWIVQVERAGRRTSGNNLGGGVGNTARVEMSAICQPISRCQLTRRLLSLEFVVRLMCSDYESLHFAGR